MMTGMRKKKPGDQPHHAQAALQVDRHVGHAALRVQPDQDQRRQHALDQDGGHRVAGARVEVGEDARQVTLQAGDEDQSRVGHLVGHQRDEDDARPARPRRPPSARGSPTRRASPITPVTGSIWSRGQHHHRAERGQQVDRRPARPNPRRSSSVRSCAPTGTPHPCCTASRHRPGTAARCRRGSRRRRSSGTSRVVPAERRAPNRCRPRRRTPQTKMVSGQHAVDDEDDVHDLLVGGELRQRQPDHRPQDHQLQDDAHRQARVRRGTPAAGTAARSPATTRR